MTNLKLAKLPDRTPTRITITVSADLNQALCDYQIWSVGKSLRPDPFHARSLPQQRPRLRQGAEGGAAGDQGGEVGWIW